MSCVKAMATEREGQERPPAENMKEDIFTARKVKDTLGFYPLNEKVRKLQIFFFY